MEIKNEDEDCLFVHSRLRREMPGFTKNVVSTILVTSIT